MYKKIALAMVIFIAGQFASNAQKSIAETLEIIANNNKELQLFIAYKEKKIGEIRLDNSLDNIDLEMRYLPWKQNKTNPSWELTLSQSFNLPFVYFQKNKCLKQERIFLENEEKLLKQKVFLEAKLFCLELIYWQKQKKAEEKRQAQSQEIFEQLEAKLKISEVGALEINKAKIALLQQKNRLEKINNQIQSLLINLQKLNNGEPLNFVSANYEQKTELLANKELEQEFKTNAYEFKLFEAKKNIAETQVRITKNEFLPTFKLGAVYEYEEEQKNYGIVGGVSVPLWKGNKKLNVAKKNKEIQLLEILNKTNELQSSWDLDYQNYLSTYKQFSEYKKALENLNTDDLLFKAYNLGEITFAKYFLEMEFYRNAYDQLLKMEWDLQTIYAKLTKFKL